MRPPLFEKRARVLFQGDSITDMGRGRTEDPNHLLGHGYAFIVSAREAADFPEREITFLNRGISGNTSSDLAARWQADTLELQPTVLSLLIGVNDLNHKLRDGHAFHPDEYGDAVDELLAQTMAALPNVKLILGEPFFSHGTATALRFEERQTAMAAMREILGKLGGKYRAPVVPYQALFDDAATRAPAEYWIWDGVHPTFAGHQLMAREWERCYTAFHSQP